MPRRSGHTRTNKYGTTFTVREHDFMPGNASNYPKLEWKHGYACIKGSYIYEMPCPKCGDSVFYYRNMHGSRVFFDDLGAPWPKHPCMEGAQSYPMNFVDQQRVRESEFNESKKGNPTPVKWNTDNVSLKKLERDRNGSTKGEIEREKRRLAYHQEERRLKQNLEDNRAKWEEEGKPRTQKNAGRSFELVTKCPVTGKEITTRKST